MSGGYSSKIYKKRKNLTFPLSVLVIFILSISIFIHFSKGNLKSKPASESEILKSKPKAKKVTGIEKVPENNIKVNKEKSMEVAPLIDEKPGISIEQHLAIQNRAIFYTKKKQYRKAIDEYRILLNYDKRFSTIIGICYFWMHDFDKAVFTLKEADDSGHFPYKTKKFLAFSYYELNDLPESSKYAQEALKYGEDSELRKLIVKLKKEENVMKHYKDIGMENFLIQFSREEHDQLRTIVSDYLKEAYKEIGKKLDYFPNKQFIVILYNERDFFDITRAPGWAGGLYDGKIRLPVKGIIGQNHILRKVIFHEYTHALISEITQNCPLWLNEGLAEYFSETERVENLTNVIPLNRIEKIFPSGNPRLVSLAYLTSHDAVEYLIDKFGIYSVKELLENFGEGMDINSAFESALYISYEDFQFKWRKEK